MTEEKKWYKDPRFGWIDEPKPKKKPKGNPHYKVGYALERDVKIALEQDGYTVFRMAGSHSPADLIAFYPPNKPTLIQCKRHKNLMTKQELVDFWTFAENLACASMIAYRDKGIHLDSIHT